MKITFEKRLLLFFTLIFTGIIILGVVAYKSNRSIRETNALVDHTKEVIAESELVLSLTKDIVIGSQRYVITGDSAMLGDFPKSRKTVFVHIQKLKALTADNPVQQARIDSLKYYMEKRVAFSEAHIITRNEKGFDKAAARIASGKGKELTDKIRDLIGSIEGHENFLLITGQRENNYSVAAFNRAFYALLISVFIFLGIIFFYIRYNLSKRAKAEEHLRQSEAQVQTIFKGAPDAVIVIDDEGKIVNWNTRAEMLFGWTAKEVIGKTLADTIIPHRYREAHTNGMKHYLESGEGPVLNKTIEIQALNKNGVEFDIGLSISPVFLNDRRMFIGFIQDITERKKADEELKSSRENFRRLFEFAPYPMWVYDLQTMQFLEVNNAAVAQYGYSREEFLKMHLKDIRPAEEIPRLMESLKTRRQVDRQSTTGWRHLLRNGQVIDVEITSQLFNFSGSQAALVIANNITERKKAEEAMRDTNYFLDTILENIPNMIFVKDADELRFVRFNKAGEDLLGYSRKDLLGKNDYDFFPKDQADFFTAKDKDVIKKGKLLDIPEEPINTATGERFLHTKKIPISDEHGKPVYLLGISEDITEQKRAAQQMKDLNERFLKIFNLSPVAMSISLVDDGKFVQVNEAFEKLFLVKQEEVIGKTSVDLKLVDVDVRKSNVKELEKEKHLKAMELRVRKKSGEAVDTITSIEIIEIDGRKSFLTAIIDITERKKSEDQILHLNMELERNVEQLQILNKELEAFTYSVSHDLRAPLRIIDGYAEIISHDFKELNEEGRQNLQVIKDNARKMGQLIDDLLNLSRLGRKQLVIHVVNMNEVIEEVLTEQEILKSIRHIEVKKNDLLPAKCDSSLILQVWSNLISNAIKYSRYQEKPVIEIGSYKQDTEVVYYVKDNGVGFDMQYAGKLFGVFQRLHKMTEFEGTGVGLAIVQRVVLKHGGRAWTEAEVDKGATFYFSLPL